MVAVKKIRRLLNFLPFLALTFIPRTYASCIDGSNLQNAGASCDFDSNNASQLCGFTVPEGSNLTWKSGYNPQNRGPCVAADTGQMGINQMQRLRSPLLCATNSTFFTYNLQFSYSIYHSNRCRFSLRLLSENGDRLNEIWNTQETTFGPRLTGWKTVTLDISNVDVVYYIVFGVERISQTDTVQVLIDTVSFTTEEITTTTTTTTTSTTTPPTTTETTTVTTPTPTTTTTLSTTTATTTQSTTTPTTTTATTTTTTTTPTTFSTTTEKTTSEQNLGTTMNSVLAASIWDRQIIWGLKLEYLIAIGAGIVFLLVFIVCIARCCCRSDARPPDPDVADVKTISFSLQNPTAYDVSQKNTKKSKKGKFANSKQKVWEPDMSLY